MTFRISGLDPAQFHEMIGASDAALAALGAKRYTADASEKFPCRISLADADIGDTLILLNYEYLPGPSPYGGRGPIFINENATQAAEWVDAVPPKMLRRLLSIRAYDAATMIIDADVVPGEQARDTIERLFQNESVVFLHVHNARRGCFAGRVDRT